MSNAELVPVSLPDAVLEVRIHGTGEPVVLIQTALTADELLPLASRLDLSGKYTTILYHRRGYAGSSPVQGPGSIDRDAVDCEQLLAALGIRRAHVVGLSYSAAVALQLAASSSERVHSLCLIEPPPVHVPSGNDFMAANVELAEEYRLHGSAAALDRFLGRLIGPDWRRDIERHLPTGPADAERDAETFFVTDIAALLAWRSPAQAAQRLTQPVLYVGGAESGQWFAEVRDVVLEWLPHTEEVLIPGADHSLALTHTAVLAAATEAFWRSHPIGA